MLGRAKSKGGEGLVATKLSSDLAVSGPVRTPAPETIGAYGAHMTAGLLVLNSEAWVTYCSGPASSLLGIPPNEALGRLLKELPCFQTPCLDSPHAFESLLSAILTPVERLVTVPLLLAQPQRRELVVTAFPIPVGPEERMSGLLIWEASEEQQGEHRWNSLVSMACHELCSPITTILGFTELLLRVDPSKEERQGWLGIIQRDTQRLAAIVGDLLDASGLQSGNLTVNLTPLSLPETVEKVLAGIRPVTDQHEFVVEINSDIPEVIADCNKLSQILVNLLENAVKYSPQGGVITVSACYQPEQGQVVVSVTDQGLGIAPEDQSCVFTPFQRIRRLETEGIKGTGLGLYIVKELLALMRGEIWLKSELDQGSSFFFSLPTGRVQSND